MSRRALILGTLPGQTDAITRLQREGWTVFACGHERVGTGVAAADEFFLADILDVDQVAELAERLAVDVVYSVGSDIAMPTVAAVSARLGLASFHDLEVTETLHRKGRMRTFLARQGLSPVQHAVVDGEDALSGFGAYPAILKPADSQGQRGISVVASHDEAVAALPEALGASRSSTAIIEEFLDGPEISIHVVVVDGVVALFLPSDRHVWEGPVVGFPEGHTMPASFLDEDTTAAARELVDRVVAGLGVTDGPLYFQMILTSAGPRIVEVAPRLDGCHLWRLIEVHSDWDLLTALFRLLVGDGWQGPASWPSSPSHTLRFHLSAPDEPFDPSDHDVSRFGTVVYEEFQVEPGTTPRSINDHVARVGYAITEDTGS